MAMRMTINTDLKLTGKHPIEDSKISHTSNMMIVNNTKGNIKRYIHPRTITIHQVLIIKVINTNIMNSNRT